MDEEREKTSEEPLISEPQIPNFMKNTSESVNNNSSNEENNMFDDGNTSYIENNNFNAKISVESQLNNSSKNYQFSYKTDNRSSSESVLSFTDLLGTFRVRLIHFYIPIIITVFSATFLAWLSVKQAGIQINAAMVDPDESSTLGIILNGLVPVLISAAFLTIIWFTVKKWGMNVFKVIMGLFVFFYVWWGFMFFVDITYIISYDYMVSSNETFYALLYYGLMFGSLLAILRMAYLYFKNSLSLKYRNLLVLLFGIFLGSIIGISFPTWTTFSFAIFLSIWDLIAVFKGPLGKLAGQINENRNKVEREILEKLEKGEISESEAQEYLQYSTLREMDDEEIKVHLNELEIELGSGDLILYSALVAHIFVSTTSWFITALVLIGVFGGAFLTLFLLIKYKRVLPALPFSMLFGIIAYFIGQGLILLF